MTSFFRTALTAPPTPEQLDILRIVVQALTESGTTAQRPTAQKWVGRTYFDTTIGKPIWFNGAGWQDAAGNPV